MNYTVQKKGQTKPNQIETMDTYFECKTKRAKTKQNTIKQNRETYQSIDRQKQTIQIKKYYKIQKKEETIKQSSFYLLLYIKMQKTYSKKGKQKDENKEEQHEE